MAKVVGPLHSSEARGSVGALTYNTWRGISTVKTRSGPTIQYSADQVALRLLTKTATVAWQALTNDERNSWNDYSVSHPDIDWTGNPQRISAYNWFVRINVRRQILGYTINDTPPGAPITWTPQNLRTSPTINDIYVEWDPQLYEPIGDTYLEFYINGPHSPGRTPNIQACNRIAHEVEYTGLWAYEIANGLYTVFARPIDISGQVGTFLRLLATSSPP